MIKFTNRKGSPTIESMALVGVALVASAFVASFLARGLAPQQGGANISVESLSVKQGSALAVLAMRLSNTGHSPLTSFAVGVNNLESASGTFTAAISVKDTSTGSSLYSGSSTVRSPSFSITFTPSASVSVGKSVDVFLTITSGVQEQALFNPGNSYTVTVSVSTSQGGAQAVASVVASQM